MHNHHGHVPTPLAQRRRTSPATCDYSGRSGRTWEDRADDAQGPFCRNLAAACGCRHRSHHFTSRPLPCNCLGNAGEVSTPSTRFLGFDGSRPEPRLRAPCLRSSARHRVLRQCKSFRPESAVAAQGVAVPAWGWALAAPAVAAAGAHRSLAASHEAGHQTG